MAYDANGNWKYEDADTLTQVSKVVDAGGPLMKQARGIGQMTAAKRGLGNSSIAAQASEAAVLDKATTIGGQTAAQINATNISEMGNRTTLAAEGMRSASAEKIANLQITADMARLDKQIAANSALAAQGDAAAMERLKIDVASRDALQKEQLASSERVAANSETAAMDRQKLQSTTSLTSQSMADAAAAARQKEQLTSAEKLSANELASLTERQRAEIEANAKTATLDATTKLNIADLDRQQNANANALNAATSIQNAYMASMSALMQNENIPAAARESYAKSMQTAAEASIGLVEQMTGQDLVWGNNFKGTGAPGSYNIPTGATAKNDTGTSYTDAAGVANYKQANGSWYRVYPDGRQTVFDPTTGKETNFG